MRILTWNLCTTFAALGAAIAYGILLLLFGFHGVIFPGALLGLGAAYVVSTALGAVLIRIRAGHRLVPALILGGACALLTLIAGAFALGIGNFVTETAREIFSAPAGQPLWNRLAEFAPGNAVDFIFQPVLAGTFFGAIPALALGLIFGGVLHARTGDGDHQTSQTKAWTIGGAGLIALALAVLWFSITESTIRAADSYASMPMTISECGQTAIGTGVLAYCRGFPCDAGECQIDFAQGALDAFAIYVEPPPAGGWSWAGGGLGTTKRADEVGHQMYWVRRDASGFLNEESPRRHQSFRLRFDGDQVVLADKTFGFYRGMLLVVRFDHDWSMTASAGRDSLNQSGLTISELQSVFEKWCAEADNCETAFQLKVEGN